MLTVIPEWFLSSEYIHFYLRVVPRIKCQGYLHSMTTFRGLVSIYASRPLAGGSAQFVPGFCC